MFILPKRALLLKMTSHGSKVTIPLSIFMIIKMVIFHNILVGKRKRNPTCWSYKGSNFGVR